jgi:hypothetical protein
MSKSGFLEYCKQSIQARDEHTDGIRSSGLHFINVKPSSNKQIIGNCLCPKMAALRRQGCLLPKLKFRGICCQPKKSNGASHLLHTPRRGSRSLAVLPSAVGSLTHRPRLTCQRPNYRGTASPRRSCIPSDMT